jgi:uncharacterized membrane protein HdeD (DUF308 family)
VPRADLTAEHPLELKGLWWLLLFVGLASLVAGVVLVAQPSDSLATLAVVVGIFLLIDGIVELVSALGRDVENRAIAAILGVLGIVVGIALIRHPFHGVSAIGILIGIWLVASGVIRLLRAVVSRHPLLASLIALVEIVAGIAIVANPHIGYTTLAVLTGIWLIINGIGTVAFGWSIRSEEREARTSPSRPS